METLATDTPALFAAAVQRAVAALQAGEVVALPTETVYGLAANAFNALAVQSIFQIKGRPSRNPIIVHVAGLEMARQCVAVWSTSAQKLADAFWPGPLTLVLPKSPRIPDNVTAAGSTVGIRWPSHPLMQAVICACGFPLAAPSANLSNRLSPTTADHVRQSLGDKVSLIVDGGYCHVGIESTVVDLTAPRPQILRPGMIHLESIRAAIDVEVNDATNSRATAGVEVRSPGQLALHYSPKARLVVRQWKDEQDLERQLAEFDLARSKVFLVTHHQIPLGLEGVGGISVVPHDADAFARALYGELHRCDAEGALLIIVEEVPDTHEWKGVADRLRRASR